VIEGTDNGSIRFYFSFRSPYAWLAAERLESELGDLAVSIDRIPISVPSKWRSARRIAVVWMRSPRRAA
jgi:2-hydroxychromene-2-carboxylate isomerase